MTLLNDPHLAEIGVCLTHRKFNDMSRDGPFLGLFHWDQRVTLRPY